MTAEQNSPPEYSVLLIDLDNCPRQFRNLPHTIEQFTRVVACYGKQEPKIPLNLVTFLAKAISNGKLEIVGMQKKGKNAADFGLTFWAGRLMAELPPETEFIILSEDTDLNHVINLLHTAGRKATRINGKSKNITLDDSQDKLNLKEEIDPPILDVVAEYYYQILQPGKSRPRTKKTLHNNITSYFKKRKQIKPEKILQGLIDREFIEIDGHDRVIYSDKEELPF